MIFGYIWGRVCGWRPGSYPWCQNMGVLFFFGVRVLVASHTQVSCFCSGFVASCNDLVGQ